MNKRIMIVDDDPSIRTAVTELFNLEGFEARGADGGAECLEELGRGFKGVILMDIMMPEMDGWDTIKEMVDQGYYEGNVVFMLTAKDAPDQKMEGLQEYVLDYVTKPFEPDELLATVEGYASLLE